MILARSLIPSAKIPKKFLKTLAFSTVIQNQIINQTATPPHFSLHIEPKLKSSTTSKLPIFHIQFHSRKKKRDPTPEKRTFKLPQTQANAQTWHGLTMSRPQITKTKQNRERCFLSCYLLVSHGFFPNSFDKKTADGRSSKLSDREWCRT